MAVKLKITGLKKAENFLKNKNRDAKDAVADTMSMIGFFMEGEVKQSIAGHRAELRSVDTGRFLNSVQNTSNRTQAKIYSPVEYSQYLEYGTSRIPARRHFNNSLARNRPVINKKLQSVLKDRL